MKSFYRVFGALTLVLSMFAPLFAGGEAQATGLASDAFTGISTPANAWVSGGSGGSLACLTAATSSASNSIPACSGGPLDSVGSGVLQLTPNTGGRSGFAIYNTPVSASQGLDIKFDMYQYGGTGADGISFFLVDGASSPTQPGASGGALGYASSGVTAGLVGGYVGVGFDRYGNFSSSAVGAGGPGAVANSITVRGSAGTNYQYVTKVSAHGSLSSTTRANSRRHVEVRVNTNNIMSVSVDYGSGYVNELSSINLNTINGAGSLPANFKFGFAASTGGSYDAHEISGLTVNTNPPNVGINVSHTGNFTQGTAGQFTLAVSNNSSAEATADTITVTDTLPAGLTPTTAIGTGWTCGILGQTVTCTRPGSGGDALASGASAPDITLGVNVAANAPTSLDNTATVDTTGNAVASPSSTDSVTILNADSGDGDGVINSVEAAAPNGGDANNDGIADGTQASVTSLVDSVTGNYATLQNTGCTGTNSGVSVSSVLGNAAADGSYQYPAGMMAFSINCANPGDTATITQYYFGTFNLAGMVARKYSTATHSYETVPGSAISQVTIGGLPAIKIVYQVTDGSSLDEDGTANGVIVDPVGPAVLAAAVAAPNTGLPSRSTLPYGLAVLIGLGVLGYEVRRSRAARKATRS